MTPQLRSLLRRKQREFVKNRYSSKYKKLLNSFRRLKKSTIRSHYAKVTDNLKSANPSKFFKTMREISDYESNNTSEECFVQELQGLSNVKAAEIIAQHFSAISNTYLPVQLDKLP